MPAVIFSIAIFVSAGLLFWVQPMIAKMLLPWLGGTPAVWNTCMVFFQAVLLAGYAYSHFLTQKLGRRAQLIVHLSLAAVVWLALPIHLPESWINTIPTQSNPVWWLLGCLLKSVGLPFFIVSTTGPLLQKWFSHTGHRAARDPYFLYAASNLGSLIALLGYPVLLEPTLRLGEQSALWTNGYALFGLLLLGCAGIVFRQPNTGSPGGEPASDQPQAGESSGITWPNRLRWIFLSFVPSSLMLGVTTYLSTDIASIPLLWILPLSLYLLTFIIVFGVRSPLLLKVTRRMLAPAALTVLYLLLTEATHPEWMLIALNLLFFLIAALVCHGTLAAERPPPSQLTEFYLLLSVGGVLGGLFNALFAPMVFDRVLEYPIAIILAVYALPIHPNAQTSSAKTRLQAIAPVFILIGTVALGRHLPFDGQLPMQLRLGILFGLPLLACYFLVDNPGRFAMALMMVLLASQNFPGAHGRTLVESRNFFGVLRVTLDRDGKFRRMVHGNTIHGRQFVTPDRQCEPLSYYHRTGPAGQIFESFNGKTNHHRVGVIGLGTGTLACYETPGQDWTYYEINPTVVALARDTNYFSFMGRCASVASSMVLGDARLRVREAADRSYDLIVLDAFSSDSIPIHLITRDAISLYLSKLAPAGMIGFHISNRSLELEPILGDIAASLGLYCTGQDENDPSAEEMAQGKDQSHWVVIARRKEEVGRLAKDSRWIPVKPRKQPEVWTDDFSNIWSVFHWK